MKNIPIMQALNRIRNLYLSLNPHSVKYQDKSGVISTITRSQLNLRFCFQRGLCYTFNSGKNGQPLLKVTTSGRSQSLALYLNAEPEEYYGPYSYDTTGFKIYVHDQSDVLPNMEDNAYDVSPGFTTVVRIRRRKVKRFFFTTTKQFHAKRFNF